MEVKWIWNSGFSARQKNYLKYSRGEYMRGLQPHNEFQCAPLAHLFVDLRHKK